MVTASAFTKREAVLIWSLLISDAVIIQSSCESVHGECPVSEIGYCNKMHQRPIGGLIIFWAVLTGKWNPRGRQTLKQGYILFSCRSIRPVCFKNLDPFRLSAGGHTVRDPGSEMAIMKWAIYAQQWQAGSLHWYGDMPKQSDTVTNSYPAFLRLVIAAGRTSSLKVYQKGAIKVSKMKEDCLVRTWSRYVSHGSR